MNQNNSRDDFVNRKSYAFYHPKKSKLLKTNPHAPDESYNDRDIINEGETQENFQRTYMDATQVLGEKETFSRTNKQSNNPTTCTTNQPPININFQFPQLSVYPSKTQSNMPTCSSKLPVTPRWDQEARQSIASNVVQTIKREVEGETPVLRAAPQISLQASKVHITLKEPETKPFKCEVCQHWFYTREKLIIHFITNHGKHHCSYCTEMFDSDLEREDHEKVTHIPLECDVCKIPVINLNSHYEDVHDIKNCRFCGVLVKPKSYYKVHVQKKHFVNNVETLEEKNVRLVDNWTDSADTWNFNCHLCGKERKRADIFGHFFSYHRLSLMCLIVFLRTEELVFNVQGTLTPSGAQADSFEHSADDSSKTSQTSGISSSIITYADLQNRSDCTVCTKPFTFQVPKPAHDIFCWGLTICRYCSKTFTDKVTRNVHMENEHLSFPCCRGCDKTITFSQETELLAHYKEVHAEIMCHYCEAFLPNNQLKLADHLKLKHGASSRSKMLEDKDIELVQMIPKSRTYICSLCNTNITSSMEDIGELFKHLQYHKISLLSTLLLLEKLQTTAKTGTKSKSQVKTKKPKKVKGEENTSMEFENSVDDSLPLNLDTKVEFSRLPTSSKKPGLAAKAKKMKDFQGKELSMLTSPEKNGCKRRETVIKRGSAKMKKIQDTDGNRGESGSTTGHNEEDFGSEVGLKAMKSVLGGMDLGASHNTSLDSSSDSTSEEEDFGSEEAIDNSTEEDDDLKDVLANVDCLLPLEIEIGEAEIDPTEIECVISDTSDDEDYEDSSELDSSFEVRDVGRSLSSGQDNVNMQCEPFHETSTAYGSQQHRGTVLKHSVFRDTEDSVEKRMADLFNDTDNDESELDAKIRMIERKYLDSMVKEISGGQGTSSTNHIDLNTINSHRPNDNRSIFVESDAHSDQAAPNSALNKNCTQEAISDCQVFKSTLNNIKTDPDDASCVGSGVNQVFSAKHPVLKCELCIEEKSNFGTPNEYIEHLKTFHKFTISAHCSNSVKKDCGDGLPGYTKASGSVRPNERGESSDEVYQCPFCAIRSSWKTTMRHHLFQVHYKDCAVEMPSSKLAYDCRYCTQRFWRVTDRNEHQIVKHEDQFYEFYKCYICSQISSSKLMLTRHLKVSHPAEAQFGAVSYKCKLCLLTFPSLGLLREHFTATHPSAMVFPCRQCNITLKNKKTLKTHIKNIHMDGTTNRRRDCTLCGKTLYSKRAYAIHYRMKHSVSSKVGFRCRICQKRFDTKDERKMHYAVGHLGESPYHCGECGKGFASKSGMYGHKQLHTGTGVSKCEYCGKEFTRKDSYNEHLLIHNGPRHKCPHCPKDFVQRSNLVRHIRIHTGEKPYKCLYCDKCFSDKGACNSHIRVHTREETCSCPYCGQTFSKKQKLKYHIRKHTGEGLIHCEICAKSFTNSFALKEHRLIHNRETQILCGTCGKGFNSEKYLQRHVAIVHEPLQMFACPLCEKSFTQQTRLKAHLMTHTGVKHMKCLLCDKAYSVRKSLRRHLLDKHQIAPEHPQYKRCFYALSPAEAGLQLPSDLSCFVAYEDDDSTTREELIVKNTAAKRSQRKQPKNKLIYTEGLLKESTDKKVKRKIATKKAAVGKALGLSMPVETERQEKPSTSRVVKKRQKSLPKKLIIPKPQETPDDSSCSCGESHSNSSEEAESEETSERVDAREATASQAAESGGTGRKKQRVEAIVEILQKTSSSPSSGSTNPEEEEESTRDESSDNEPVLARILALNTPRVTGVGRRKLGQKSVPEKLSRKEKRSSSFKSSDDFS